MSGHSTYQPKTAITRWLDTRLPILRLSHDSFVDYPTPSATSPARPSGSS